MSDLPLAGRVVAIVGTGSDTDRAVAMGCAEAGADLALGAASDQREHVYGMNSIANEVWAIGRQHFVKVLADENGIATLVHDARERFGRCDAILAAEGTLAGDIPLIRPGTDAAETVQRVVAALPS